MANVAKSIAPKLFMVLFCLCFGLSVASAKEPYADVFAFIQKMQTMHPLTIEKLLNEGFAITSHDDYNVKRFLGTAPELKDGTQFEGFDFVVSSEDPSKTQLTVAIIKTSVTYGDFKKAYPSHDTFAPYPYSPRFLHHRVQAKEANFEFIFSQEKPDYMEAFIITTYPN